jgi:hypothetical protein
MKKLKVTVFFTCSNQLEVEVPEDLSGDDLGYFVQKKLDVLPEVMGEGIKLEFPVEFQVEGDDEQWDLG